MIPNDRLLSIVEPTTRFEDAFRIADDVLRQAVQAISNVITHPGEINMDFANVRTVMTGRRRGPDGHRRSAGPGPGAARGAAGRLRIRFWKT